MHSKQAKGINNSRAFLGTEKIGRLIFKFAVPGITAYLVSGLYNIVDQIFIGQGVGMLGNAATNVAMPLSTLCTALSLLLGVGAASCFNLEQGKGDNVKASNVAANGIILMLISGIVLSAIVLLFLEPLMKLFGASDNVLPLAMDYTRITAIGFPFLVFSVSFATLIRSDGSPVYAMLCTLAGALINAGLDPLFIFVFGWGIKGAAIATVISQFISAALAFIYLFRLKTIKFNKNYFKLNRKYVRQIIVLGMAACFNQLAMMTVQIVLNNTLTRYGANSVYGSDIPLASVGVIMKFNIILMAFLIGTAQGCQPIVGYNYGAKNYGRVRKTFFYAAVVVTSISIIAFACFQLFPRQIISIFGQGEEFTELYYLFAEKYFKIFMFLTFSNGILPLTSNFFTSIGKAPKGILLSMTRQIIFLLPLIIIFPIFFGIDGILYAGPIADAAALILAVILISLEMKKISKLQKEAESTQTVSP